LVDQAEADRSVFENVEVSKMMQSTNPFEETDDDDESEIDIDMSQFFQNEQN
jgi:hypothetical protein